MKVAYVDEKLAKVLGSTPEFVPSAMLRKDFELLAGATGGHRIAKYGVDYGLTPLFQALGDAVAVPAIKDYASLIGHGVAGSVSLIALLVAKGKWTRIVAWGGLFRTVEVGINYIESLVVPK